MSFSSNEPLWKNGMFQMVIIVFSILLPIAIAVSYYSSSELDRINNMTCSELQQAFLNHDIRTEDNQNFAQERYLGLGCK